MPWANAVARVMLAALDEGQPGRQVLPSAELARRGALWLRQSEVNAAHHLLQRDRLG